jgi:hypothetical protein
MAHCPGCLKVLDRREGVHDERFFSTNSTWHTSCLEQSLQNGRNRWRRLSAYAYEFALMAVVVATVLGFGRVIQR